MLLPSPTYVACQYHVPAELNWALPEGGTDPLAAVTVETVTALSVHSDGGGI